MKKKIYNIIDSGENKGLRLYNEALYGSDSALYSEFEVFFNNLSNNNVSFYLLNNSPNTNIILNQDDFNYLNQSREQRDNNKMVNYSQNINLIKNNQLQDFWKIYNINGLEIWFVLPYLTEDNKYYYNLLIGLNNNGNIDDFLNLNLNLVKINSFEYINNKISYEFFKSIFNFENFLFKDEEFTKEERELIDNHEKLKLTEEYIEHQNSLDESIAYMDKYNTIMPKWLEDKKQELQKKLFKKSDELFDHRLGSSISFKKLSYHLYYYDETIWKGTTFCTNFFELAGGGYVNVSENSSQIKQMGYVYALIDLLHYEMSEFFVFRNLSKLK